MELFYKSVKKKKKSLEMNRHVIMLYSWQWIVIDCIAYVKHVIQCFATFF